MTVTERRARWRFGSRAASPLSIPRASPSPKRLATGRGGLAEVNPSDRALLRQVSTVAAALSGGLGRQVTVVAATNAEQISLKLKSGVEVNWGSATDSALKAEIVTALLESGRADSIDVSSPHNPATR